MKKKALNWWKTLPEDSKKQYFWDMFPERNYLNIMKDDIVTIHTTWTSAKALETLEKYGPLKK